MGKFVSWFDGKKTYIAVGAGLVEGVLLGLNDAHVITYHLPWYVMAMTGFLGAAALRSGVSKQAEKTTEDAAVLVMSILQDLQQPEQATAVEKALQVTQTPAYKTASEHEQTEMLNDSQLTKGKS